LAGDGASASRYLSEAKALALASDLLETADVMRRISRLEKARGAF
jgi:hypothetical protein